MKDNKGMAMLEALPIIMLMFVLMGATLGSWGIVHTAILNSIAARNGTFFYFNNRSDLSYLRDFYKEYDSLAPDKKNKYFKDMGKRFLFVQSEKYDPNVDRDDDGVFATLRRVDFRNQNTEPVNQGLVLSDNAHSNIESITTAGKKNKKEAGQTSDNKRKAWIMVGYGICLNANCAD